VTGYQTGPRAGQQRAAARLQAERDRLVGDLVRWAGDRAAGEAGARCRGDCTANNCEDRARDSAEHDWHDFGRRLPMADLRARWEEELAQRAVERARREGVI
jgi:hypothetical protein